MPFVPGPAAVRLLTQAQFALDLTQETLGARLGISRRTMSRWVKGGGGPTVAQVCDLARLVHPIDAALASELAAEGGETLESLGLVVPTAPARGAILAAAGDARAFPPLRLLVDAVVCAAADTMQVPPGPVRELLRVAFVRARDLGLSRDEVIDALSPAPAPAPRSDDASVASTAGAPPAASAKPASSRRAQRP